jgi:cytochrome c553
MAPRLAFLAMALAVASPASAQEPDGRILALSCINCHGPGGKGGGDIPTIANKSEMVIRSALIDFREGKRAATVMTRLAKGYTDAEIAALAKHIATWK